MSEKKNTPYKLAPKHVRDEFAKLPKADPNRPSCRYCTEEPPKVQLIRINDTELGEVLNELCPPGMFGLKESELSEWCCPECKRVLEKTYEVASRVAAAQRTILQYTNHDISLSTTAIAARDSERASTSRATDQFLSITTATDEIKKLTTVAKDEPLPLLEDSPATRLRERRQALRSRMRNREDPDEQEENHPTVVRAIRALFSPPFVNPGEEAPANQPPPVHQVVCIDELEVVFRGQRPDKRVPDILTPAPSEEDEPPRTPSPCSSGTSGASEQDLAMLLKEPSHLCEHCSLMFLTQQQLGWHLRTHTGRSTIRCRLCPRVLPKVSSFLQHQAREHPVLRRTYCILCNEYFRSECRAKHDQQHLRTRMKYACSFCPLIFYNHKQQKHHRQLFHNDWKLMCRMAPKTEQN